MKHEDIYTAVQAYLDNKFDNEDTELDKNNLDRKTHIQDLVGKKISLNNIKIVSKKNNVI